jgi:O-acetylhomoserine/O-acetylserine sulfhydrylase-like pyridoxal-dependent enzyme
MRHTGNVGRLPKDRRNELALRIEDGQTGAEIAKWLNAQPDVREILFAQFAGRPVTV